MSNPFEILDVNKDWAVVWPSFDTMFTDKMKFDLLDLVFEEVNCHEVGLGMVELDDDGKKDYTIMWVKQDIWFNDLTDEYTRYLYKYYHIGGAVFHELKEAEHFKDILEKRYAWQLLKE